MEIVKYFINLAAFNLLPNRNLAIIKFYDLVSVCGRFGVAQWHVVIKLCAENITSTLINNKNKTFSASTSIEHLIQVKMLIKVQSVARQRCQMKMSFFVRFV